MDAETAAAVGQGFSAGGFEFLLVHFYFHSIAFVFTLSVFWDFVRLVYSILFSVNCDTGETLGLGHGVV